MSSAAGGAAWRGVSSIVAEGTETSSGLTGRWREAVDLKAPRMMQREDAGILHSLSVWRDGLRWRQNSSGGVHPLSSAFGRECAITEVWLEQRAYLRPGAGGARFTPFERRTDKNATFLVTTATPRDGQPVELWFDARTLLLARTTRRMNLETETVNFGDYRPVHGLMLPFEIVEGDPPSAETLHVASYSLNSATGADFARPERPNDSNVEAGRTTVPIEFNGDVIVQAKINGKGPYGFILDTGGHDILTPAAAQALGLTSVGAGQSGGAGEGKVSEQYAHVDRLEIGGMTMRDQTFTIIPMGYATVERGPRPQLAGILGLEVFERFAVRIDYRGKTLTLEPLETYAHNGPGTPLAIRFNDDEPLVDATLEGRTGDFGIDTGNAGSIIVQGRWADREGLTPKLKSGLDSVGFGMGGMSHNWSSRVDLTIAGVPLPHMIGRYQKDRAGAFASIVEAGNIGSDVLANFTVDFDYARGQMWFQPVPGFTPPPFNRSGLGASKVKPDAFIVVLVSQNSPAADAGLKAGDEIAAVDGVPSKDLAYDDLFRTLRQAPGTQVKLDFVRGGTPMSATLTLRELLP